MYPSIYSAVAQLFEPQVRKCKNSPFSRTAGHIFVSPGDAPAIITQYVAWMERQFNACQTPRSMYPSVFNSFPVIRTASAKTRRFHVPQPTFLFPLETPLRLSPNMFHGCKDNLMVPKPLAACIYICIYLEYFPSYTMLKSMRKSKNRYFYHILVSPGDAPGAITLNVVCVKREFDAYKLSRCMCPSNYNRF